MVVFSHRHRVGVGSLRELDGVSTDTKVDGVTGHTGTGHHNAVASATCLIELFRTEPVKKKVSAPVPPKDGVSRQHRRQHHWRHRG